MFKRIVALSLVMVLLVAFYSPVTAVTESELGKMQDEPISYVNDAKYHFYFDNEKYYDVYDTETCVEAFLYMKGLHERVILDNELIQITIEFADDYRKTADYKKKTQTVYNSQSKSKENSAKKELRRSVKSFHKEQNKRNIELLSNLKAHTVSEIEYSPFVCLEMKIEDINIYQIIEIAEKDRIKSISFSFKPVAVSNISWETMLEEIGAFDIVGEQTFTAEGVRIGILEIGVCNPKHINLQNTSITIREDSTNYDDHTNAVASIIALMAPSAELYVSEDSYEMGIQWFADNGCDVVNCSFGYISFHENEDGTKTYYYPGYRVDIDGIYDYQIETNLISVVVASGNKSEINLNNNITSPGLAYNAITVGGLKRVWSLAGYQIKHDENACYVSSVPYVKPEISAMFTVDIENMGEWSGTSFAAPQVTACIAILMGKFPTYFYRSPTEIKALIIATANKTNDYVADRGNFDDRVGAGCIDLASMRASWYRTKEYTVPAGATAGTQLGSTSVGLTAGSELQVALAWFAHYTLGDTAVYISNYDVRIYNSDGRIVASSVIPAFTNVEMLRYTVETDGTYRIVVYLYENMNSNIPGETVHMAYSIK